MVSERSAFALAPALLFRSAVGSGPCWGCTVCRDPGRVRARAGPEGTNEGLYMWPSSHRADLDPSSNSDLDHDLESNSELTRV